MIRWIAPLLILLAAAASAEQRVRLLAEPGPSPGEWWVDLVYDTGGEPIENLTGIGVRLHYDSRRVIAIEPIEVHAASLLAQDIGVPDQEDQDADAETDRLATFAWVDLQGRWPGRVPMRIVRFRLDVTADTAITVTSSGTAAGHEFRGERIEIAP